MPSNDIENDIVAKGLTAPRVTAADIESVIVSEYYHVPPDTTLTLCVLTLGNGFNVVGESACASPENFDPEIGKRIARENAKAKIWALEGYVLRTVITIREVLGSEAGLKLPESVLGGDLSALRRALLG